MGLAQSIKGLGGYEIPAPLGRQVIREVATDLDAIDEVNLFNVIGGDVLLTGLYGRVTEAIGAVGNTTIQLWHTPTLGAVQVDLCAVIAGNIASDLVDTIFTITGDHTVGMATDATFEGVAVASFVTNYVILVPGVISLDVAVSGNTGNIRWVLHFVPLGVNSNVTVA